MKFELLVSIAFVALLVNSIDAKSHETVAELDLGAYLGEWYKIIILIMIGMRLHLLHWFVF